MFDELPGACEKYSAKNEYGVFRDLKITPPSSAVLQQIRIPGEQEAVRELTD